MSNIDARPGWTSGTHNWGWFVGLGVLLVVAGILALSNILIATAVSVMFIAVMMIVGGVAEIVHAFTVRRWAGFIFWLLAGVLYVIAGILAVANPVLAAAALTLAFGVALIVSGALRIISGLRSRPIQGWGWIVASGVITAIVGVIFVLRWPFNTLYLLGLVLAIELIFEGVSAIAFGLFNKPMAERSPASMSHHPA